MKFSTIVATGLSTSQSAAAFFGPFMAPTGTTECQMKCAKQYAPVCASDGNTYANQCIFQRITCLRGLDLEIVHDGECNQIARRSAEQNCPRFCHRMYAPVCGSDGNTYPNNCVLLQTACDQPDVNLFEVHDGGCQSPSFDVQLKSADRHTDPNMDPLTKQFAFPDEKPEPMRMRPPMCNRMYAPVCGSNGVTYSNECMMKLDAFDNNLDITKNHDGECDAEHSDEPMIEVDVIAQDCSLMCTREFNPVCGQFGDQFRIYGNPCELNVASCLTNGAVVQVDKSKCQNPDDLQTTFQLKKSASGGKPGKRNRSGSKKRRQRNGPNRDVSKISRVFAFLNRN